MTPWPSHRSALRALVDHGRLADCDVCSFLFINGVAFLIPALEAERGTPLAEAGLLSSMPSWGMVVTLIALGLRARPGR